MLKCIPRKSWASFVVIIRVVVQEEWVGAILKEVLKGLKYIHEQGQMHRLVYFRIMSFFKFKLTSRVASEMLRRATCCWTETEL